MIHPVTEEEKMWFEYCEYLGEYRPLEEALENNAQVAIINSEHIAENQIKNIANSVNLFILLKESRNLYSEVIALADVLKDKTFNDMDFMELEHDYNYYLEKFQEHGFIYSPLQFETLNLKNYSCNLN